MKKSSNQPFCLNYVYLKFFKYNAKSRQIHFFFYFTVFWLLIHTNFDLILVLQNTSRTLNCTAHRSCHLLPKKGYQFYLNEFSLIKCIGVQIKSNSKSSIDYANNHQLSCKRRLSLKSTWKKWGATSITKFLQKMKKYKWIFGFTNIWPDVQVHICILRRPQNFEKSLSYFCLYVL